MQIEKKDATIVPTGTDTDFPGTFDVILSAPTLDRDGDTLRPNDWKMPLPEHITFDTDHGMSVASTVGSGTPVIDEETGNLVVHGTYSSLPRAQETRTLVNEGHIRTTSVAFMSEKSQKDGVSIVKRELLNGAFVAIPSNREALVLSSKGVKAGARNSSTDAAKIQHIHDLALELGAAADGGVPDDKKSVGVKAFDLLENVDIASLPQDIQDAIALIEAYDFDAPQDVAGDAGPDEDAADSGAEETPEAGAKAPASGVDSAPVEDADSDAVTDEELEAKALEIQAKQFI